jgi:hypothetical protein
MQRRCEAWLPLLADGKLAPLLPIDDDAALKPSLALRRELEERPVGGTSHTPLPQSPALLHFAPCK